MKHMLKRSYSLMLALLLCLACAVPAMSEAACTHPEEYLDRTTAVRSDVAPTPVDLTYHTTTGDLYETVYCFNCETTLSETPLEADHTAVDSHRLMGGICESCGYETTCEHPEEFVDVQVYTQYSDFPVMVDDLQHSGTGTQMADYFCNECLCAFDCGTILYENTTVYETHYFLTADGTCVMCGAENPCQHEETYSFNDYADGGSFVAVDAFNHEYVGEVQRVTRCSNCEVLISSEPADSSAFGLEAHSFENGSCYMCGYQNDCEHPADMLQSWEYTIDKTYECINEKAHTSSGTLISSTSCMLCGIAMGEEILEENSTKTEAHFYYEGSNTCSGCGAENPCQHPQESVLSKSYMVETTSVTCDDEKYHTMVGTKCVMERCILCGAFISETYLPDETVRETHIYTDGVCICGRENSCEHPADRIFESSGYSYHHAEPVSAAEHTADATKYIYGVCTLCMEYVSTETVDETVTSAHIFSNGICWVCGQLNECTHPEDARQDFSYIASQDAAVTASDTDTHTRMGRSFVGTQCSICEESMTGRYEDEWSVTEPHYYLNGICYICGEAE